jgi:AmmeMemoRadiSam system protein B
MAKDNGKAKLREATVAGIFYPEDPRELEAELDRYLEAPLPMTFPEDSPPTLAILSPHAALAYSGDLAALAWKSLRGRPLKTVVILSPLHRATESALYLSEAAEFSTPLGPVAVDGEAVEDLLDCSTAFSRNDIPHFEEHGIEMQLPFLKRLYPRARLVPILLAAPNASLVKSLATALGIVFGGRRDSTLFVLSSDLAAGYEEGQTAHLADAILADLVEGDWEGLLAPVHPGTQAACGAACLAAFVASRLAMSTEAHLLGRHDSMASRTSAQERLVHYAAMAFVGEERAV